MTMFNVDNAGAEGVVTDIQPYDLPPGAWTSSLNMRFRNGHAEKFTGESEVYAGASINPYWAMAWPTGTEFRWIYTSLAKAYYASGDTHTNITRQTAAVDVDYTALPEHLWNGTVMGGVPVINNWIDHPQGWDASTDKFKDLVNWPAGYRTRIMRSYKQFLIAMQIFDGGTIFPYLVKWSTVADPGTLPTTWDIADPTQFAGETSLADTGGFIMDGVTLGDTFIIYKEDSVWGMRFVGGTYVFQFFEIFKEFGLLAQRCAKNFEGKHFIVTQGDVRVHNGQTSQSIINAKRRNELFATIDETYRDRVYVVPNYPKSEMWICFPNDSATNGIPNQAYVWNWRENTWGDRVLADIAHIAFGIIDQSPSSPIIDTVSTYVDDDLSLIDGVRFSTTEVKLLACQPSTSKLLQLDVTDQFEGVSFTSRLERTDLAIAGATNMKQPNVDYNLVKFVRSLYPKLEVAAGVTVNVYVGARQEVEGTLTWFGPFAFTPSDGQTKIDCRVSGKLIAVKFEVTANTSFKLSGYKLDLEIIGAPWPT